MLRVPGCDFLCLPMIIRSPGPSGVTSNKSLGAPPNALFRCLEQMAAFHMGTSDNRGWRLIRR